MYPILEKRALAENIWLMKILAPRVARAAQPGQFVIVRADEHGERIPLTISDYDAAQGSVTIVIQTIGASTHKICALDAGEAPCRFRRPAGTALGLLSPSRSKSCATSVLSSSPEVSAPPQSSRR